MTTATSVDVAVELARTVVREIAPAEEAIFEIYADAYDGSAPIVRGTSDDELGFGVDDLAAITPYLLVVVQPVADYLVRAIAARLGEDLKAAVRHWVTKLRHSANSTTPASTAQLTPEELITIRAIIQQRAQELELPTATARLLSESVVGALV
jgi:hypothetical protein